MHIVEVSDSSSERMEGIEGGREQKRERGKILPHLQGKAKRARRAYDMRAHILLRDKNLDGTHYDVLFEIFLRALRRKMNQLCN